MLTRSLPFPQPSAYWYWGVIKEGNYDMFWRAHERVIPALSDDVKVVAAFVGPQVGLCIQTRATVSSSLAVCVCVCVCMCFGAACGQDLLNRIFVMDPEQRLTLEQVSAHRWVTSTLVPSDDVMTDGTCCNHAPHACTIFGGS